VRAQRHHPDREGGKGDEGGEGNEGERLHTNPGEDEAMRWHGIAS
jgi:hypothetical protein